jgi:hypothetical protein
MSWRESCVYITGNARTPERSTIGSIYDVFAVELVISVSNDVVEEASCTLVTDLGRSFVRSLLINRNFVREFDVILNDIVNCYQALPQKTLITALKDARNKYCSCKIKNNAR